MIQYVDKLKIDLLTTIPDIINHYGVYFHPVDQFSHSSDDFGHRIFLILGDFQVESHASQLVGTVWCITKDFENIIRRLLQFGLAKKEIVNHRRGQSRFGKFLHFLRPY